MQVDKTIFERLALLNSGRRHYLEFLRNLTPPTILLTMALLLTEKFDFERFNLSNTARIALCAVFLGSAALSFYASCTLFYENGFKEWRVWVRDQRAELKSQDMPPWKWILQMLKATLQHRLVEFAEVLLAIVFLPIALATVVFLSTHSANGILTGTTQITTGSASDPALRDCATTPRP